jgi:hypothetical protein
MEVPWMQPFFSFPKVWFALPMAGAQEAGHRRLQRIALFRGLGDNASASWSACRYQGVRFASVAQPMAVLFNDGDLSVCRDVFWFCRYVCRCAGKCEVRNVLDCVDASSAGCRARGN